MRKTNILRSERGQTLLIYILAIFMLLLFTGLAIDGALLYMTKAKLSAAVDGACLAGMKTLSQGQTTATSIATGIFDANYGNNSPVPSVTFPTTSSGNQQVQVTATVNVHTLFMEIVPQFAIVPVSDTAVATRAKLIMTIVLDRSGSMCGGSDPCQNGVQGDDGGQALQAAVPDFISNFDQTPSTGDEVGLISFSSNSTINYAINYSFITPIDSAVSSLVFEGGTFGTGAGTGTLLSTTIGPPMSLAGLQNDGVLIQPNQSVVKVIVYFTDGLMNTIQDQFHCGGVSNSTLTLLNYGGYDNPGPTQYGAILDPTQAENIYGNASGSGFPYNSSGNTCIGSNGQPVTTFPSQQPGKGSLSFLQTNITGETQYRALQTASTLRSESPNPNYFYTVGLGDSVDSSTQMFLKEIANDPTADTYNPSQTTGEFFYIQNCPSTPASICNNEVLQVFQTIAAKVLLRLTQ